VPVSTTLVTPGLNIASVGEFGSINYCFRTVFVSCALFVLGKKIHVYFLVKKVCVAHNVHQLLFRTRFFAITKFSILGSHMPQNL